MLNLKTLLPLLTTLAFAQTSLALDIKIVGDLVLTIHELLKGSPPYELFQTVHVSLEAEIEITKRDEIEASEKRDEIEAGKRAEIAEREDGIVERDDVIVLPDYLYVLFCTEVGFRGECEVFGARPGHCVGFYSYNDTSLETTYDNNVTSLSTNTGGVCQFYLFPGCDDKGDDPGHTMSYAYDLSNCTEDACKGVFPLDGYDKNISSWRC